MAGGSRYGRIADFYDLLDMPFEYLRYRELRRRLFAGVSGEVLDAGAGTGRNVAYYPRAASLTAIDVSAGMLARARRRAERLGVDVEIREADVRDSGFADDRFDFVIASFLFCVLPEEDQLPALRELARITKPTGEIRLLDYTWSRRPLRRIVMRLWAPFVWRLYGASFDRDPGRHAAAAGLTVAEDRYLYADMIRMLVLRRE